MRLPEFHGTPVSDSLFDPFASDTGGLFWVDEGIRRETLGAEKAGQVFAPVTIIDDKYKRKARSQ
jgi:microcin C transport system substrate-binding protein